MYIMAIILITIIMGCVLGITLMMTAILNQRLLAIPTLLVAWSVYLAFLFTVSGLLALSLLVQL